MRPEYAVLVWGCLLGAIHIYLAVQFKIAQYGSSWSMGARDAEVAPPSRLLGRLMRAQTNYFETFPLVVAAVLVIGLADLHSRWTALGAVIWLAARILYLPLYAAGVPMLRTFAFMASVVGIGLLLRPGVVAALAVDPSILFG